MRQVTAEYVHCTFFFFFYYKQLYKCTWFNDYKMYIGLTRLYWCCQDCDQYNNKFNLGYFSVEFFFFGLGGTYYSHRKQHGLWRLDWSILNSECIYFLCAKQWYKSNIQSWIVNAFTNKEKKEEMEQSKQRIGTSLPDILLSQACSHGVNRIAGRYL